LTSTSPAGKVASRAIPAMISMDRSLQLRNSGIARMGSTLVTMASSS
jgi:hypothetical protein